MQVQRPLRDAGWPAHRQTDSRERLSAPPRLHVECYFLSNLPQPKPPAYTATTARAALSNCERKALPAQSSHHCNHKREAVPAHGLPSRNARPSRASGAAATGCRHGAQRNGSARWVCGLLAAGFQLATLLASPSAATVLRR